MEKEESIIDTSITRLYRICVGSTLNIKDDGLSIWNSNVIILCGNDGKSTGNCTFAGGSHQISIEPISSNTTLGDIKIQGITFTSVNDSNVIIDNPFYIDEGVITIRDCIFRVSCV